MSEKPNYSVICQEVNGFKRMLGMTMPFDRRHPDDGKNYGIGSLLIRFILAKNNQAVHFVASTSQYLPHVSNELWMRNDRKYNSFNGMGYDVGYHSPEPMWDGQASAECDVLEGGVCYCDGSALRADEWFDTWLRYGNDRIWAMLEQDWEERFGASAEEEK